MSVCLTFNAFLLHLLAFTLFFLAVSPIFLIFYGNGFLDGVQGVAINFVKSDDIKILRDIEQYYSTQIDEMPMNVADLI